MTADEFASLRPGDRVALVGDFALVGTAVVEDGRIVTVTGHDMWKGRHSVGVVAASGVQLGVESPERLRLLEAANAPVLALSVVIDDSLDYLIAWKPVESFEVLS